MTFIDFLYDFLYVSILSGSFNFWFSLIFYMVSIFSVFPKSKIDPDWSSHSWRCKVAVWKSGLRASRKNHSQRKPKCSLQRRLWTSEHVPKTEPFAVRTSLKKTSIDSDLEWTSPTTHPPQHNPMGGMWELHLEPLSIWSRASLFLAIGTSTSETSILADLRLWRNQWFCCDLPNVLDEPMQDQRFPCKQTIEKPDEWFQHTLKHHTICCSLPCSFWQTHFFVAVPFLVKSQCLLTSSLSFT